MTETIKNVHQRLAAAMGDVDYIQKEHKNGMSYTIVSHDAVTAKVRPVLLKHGIVYYPVRCENSHEGNRAQCSMTVRFVNIDAPSDYFDVPTFGYGIDPQDKGPGKAMSYAVKYALLKALGLETGDDPDTESVPYEPPPKAQAKPQTQTAKQPPKSGARDTYSALEKDMRLCKTTADLVRWWKDQECITLRKSMPEDWQRALRDEWEKLGFELKRAEEAKPTGSVVNDIQDTFPGSFVSNERLVSTLEAGE